MNINYFVIVAIGLDPDADDTYNAFFEAGCPVHSPGGSRGRFKPKSVKPPASA